MRSNLTIDESVEQVEANGRGQRHRSVAAMSGAWLSEKVRHCLSLAGPVSFDHVLGHRRLRDPQKPEVEQLAVDTRRR